jgi:hypothetical protein
VTELQQNAFHLMYMFAATLGVLFIPVIVGFVAVLLERD